MKHITRISKTGAKATVLEDLLCQVGQVVSLLLRITGGAAPIADLVDEKCILSPPPGSGEA